MFNQVIVLCLFVTCFCVGSENEIVFEYFDLAEGSTCSWNGLQGNCSNINNCQSAQDAIKRKMHVPICSFQGSTPVVCCTICKANQEITDPFKVFELDSRFNKSSKAKDRESTRSPWSLNTRDCLKYLKTLDYSCGPPVFVKDRSTSEDCFGHEESSTSKNVENSRPGNQNSKVKRYVENQTFSIHQPYDNAPAISHGKEAYRRQYPHMALLGYGDDINSAQWLCGGSVISEKYILTAAHCISSPAVGPVKFAAMGILKRSDNPEFWQTYNVTRIIAHPEYHPPSKYNDIALLETEKTISFNTDVLPACLPLLSEADEFAEATGWGALGHRQGLADVLQTVLLQRYDAEKCSQLYPKHRHLREGYNHASQMCYGDTVEAKDTCEGDSGGPLQTANVFLSCAYTVLGVTSYGRQCGVSAGSGMYTRVYHYVPWIESIVWP